MVNLLKDNLERTKKTLRKLHFSNNDPQHLLSICLLCTIYENCTACLKLFEQRINSSVSILLRNILEAHIDLINISRDKNYYNNMILSYLFQRNKILKIASEKGNENSYLKCLSDKNDIEEKYKESKKDYEQLIRDGYKNFSIKEKFMLADQLDLYLSIYNLLCQDTHNNLTYLEKRHYNADSDEIELFKHLPFEELLPYLDSINGILISSFIIVLKILKIEEDENIILSKKELDKMRMSN